MLEQVERKLFSWKGRNLSKGGNLNLVKSVLSSMPTYFIPLFETSASVVAKINKLKRDFLWHGAKGEKKLHLVGWKSICQPLQCGTLGAKFSHLMNRALLGR